MSYGVGYSIPPSLVKVVNAFLELVNVRPIEAKAGVGAVTNVFNRYVVHPDVKICRS
ncbi:hypothetical protein [Plantactinospora sp. GCM10030261]|uniref:hypothetical protein n=1 Tax=Plantactinospora sp. GCM10030261 TaxID=3273420 RepID=UPI00361612C4